MTTPGKTNAARFDRVPITTVPVASAQRAIRLIASLVVAGPVVGTALAAVLAALYGVSPIALVMFAVAYTVTTLGVTLGFHRYFAHRSFRTSRPMEIAFVILGSMALQGSLLYWVSTHRRHHQFSDTPGDPHSPYLDGEVHLGLLRGLWHSHVGWMFATDITNVVRFAPDIIRDPLIFRIQMRYLSWAALGLALPPLVVLAITGNWFAALEAFLFAGPVRLLLVHHASWAVGSISHIYGQRPFKTDDHSANNFWVALFAFGEGLQNNHHAFPTAARHAFRWWEPDLTGYIVSAMTWSGLIWDVSKPTAETIARRRLSQA